MPEFRIESTPSRKMYSDKVVYYVKDLKTNILMTKFDTNTKNIEEISGWEKFTSSQRLELQNYFANVRFVIDKLQLPAKLNKDYRLSLPEPFQGLLIELYDSAVKHNIRFDPISAMLNGLLNHIVTTQKRLKTFNQETSLPLTASNHLRAKELQDRDTRKYSKKIFKCLMAIPNGLENYTKTASVYYDKQTNLSTTTLNKYIEGKTKPSQWSISCALMVIGKKKPDIIDWLPLPLLIHLWVVPLKFIGKINDAEQARKLFYENFTVDKSYRKNIVELIDKEMKNPI